MYDRTRFYSVSAYSNSVLPELHCVIYDTKWLTPSQYYRACVKPDIHVQHWCHTRYALINVITNGQHARYFHDSNTDGRRTNTPSRRHLEKRRYRLNELYNIVLRKRVRFFNAAACAFCTHRHARTHANRTYTFSPSLWNVTK